MNTMSLNILTKNTSRKEVGGLANSDRADKGGKGVREMLTMADKRGMGSWGNADNG